MVPAGHRYANVQHAGQAADRVLDFGAAAGAVHPRDPVAAAAILGGGGLGHGGFHLSRARPTSSSD